MPRSKIFKHLSRFDELCKHTNTAIRLHSTCALCRRLCSLQLLNTLPTGRAFLALFANSLFKVERYLSSLAALFVLTRHANPNMGTCRPMHLKSKNHKDFIYLFISFQVNTNRTVKFLEHPQVQYIVRAFKTSSMNTRTISPKRNHQWIQMKAVSCLMWAIYIFPQR